MRKARETASSMKREKLEGDIKTLNKEIERLYQTISQRQSKVAYKKEVEKQIEDLNKQLPDATQIVDQAILNSFKNSKTCLQVLKRILPLKHASEGQLRI